MGAAIQYHAGVRTDILGADLDGARATGRDIIQGMIAIPEFQLGAIRDIEHAGAGAAAAREEDPRIQIDRAGVVKRHANGGGGVGLFVESPFVVEGAATVTPVDGAVEAVGVAEGAGIIEDACTGYPDGIVVITRIAGPGGVAGIHGANPDRLAGRASDG